MRWYGTVVHSHCPQLPLSDRFKTVVHDVKTFFTGTSDEEAGPAEPSDAGGAASTRAAGAAAAVAADED